MDWRQQFLRAIQAPLTAENVKALNAWARSEGTAAKFNPLATTEPAPGASSFNSVGVKNYPTQQEGIQATAETLLNGKYNRVLSLFRSGKASAAQIAEAVGQSPWGTSGELMLKVLGEPAPQPVKLTPTGHPDIPAQPLPGPSLPDAVSGLVFQNLSARMSPQERLRQLVDVVAANQPSTIPTALPVSPPPVTPAAASAPARTSGFAIFPQGDLERVGGLHPTEGLPGYPAHDYFAKAGTPVIAPVNGTVVKVSGHDPAQGPTEGPHGPFGWSAYIQSPDGATYYITHLGSRTVKPGETVKAGTVIGSVGDYARYGTPSHVHVGVHR